MTLKKIQPSFPLQPPRQRTQKRAHYKTDWHRYNLRRKAADLPPVNQESFHARSGAVDAKHAATEASQIKDPKYCASCKKGYSCEKTFAQHLLSKKHLEAVSEAGGCANHPKCPSKAPRDKDLVMQVPQNASPQEIEEIIAYNLKHSRRLALEECLFCECAPFPSLSSASLLKNLGPEMLLKPTVPHSHVHRILRPILHLPPLTDTQLSISSPRNP